MESDNEDNWSEGMLDGDESDSFDNDEAAFEGEEEYVNLSNEESKNEVLGTSQVVEVLFKELKEVQSVIQIPLTSVRILLNHFKWDKEKLMERYYSDDQVSGRKNISLHLKIFATVQDQMFKEAQVVSPHASGAPVQPRPSSGNLLDCDICCLSLHRQMMTGGQLTPIN